CMQARDFPFTF
nr:immunoglobulin light chain junction region [Macaca mulatta]MOV80002.1 immunoglobulin light chain junction region [Macaca mulatta]MOV80849.1 immunoglobulin light chain junction region [Macaca mulatta]MOV81226.1 immunoglobulin light chain junction region [Macaca mulatta]MOV81261.1 immunoglobulin light chain junction region [Macaca mulatta]